MGDKLKKIKSKNVITVISLLIALMSLLISMDQTDIAQDQTDIAISQTYIANKTLNLYQLEVNENLKFLKEQSELITKQLELINTQLEPQIIFKIKPSKFINYYRGNYTVKNIDITNDFSIDIELINAGEKTLYINTSFYTDDCSEELFSTGIFNIEDYVLLSKQNITYTLNTSNRGIEKYFNYLHSTNKSSCTITFNLYTHSGKYFRYMIIDT